VVPGDGMHIVYPLLLGMNRGRYFLLTGQTLDAQKALELGLVAEVLPLRPRPQTPQRDFPAAPLTWRSTDRRIRSYSWRGL
jgi:enoyl-CoA hydratase/carnithine racemase